MNVFVVFGVAFATALATGLGVIPVLGIRFDARRSIAVANAVAGGFMLGASGALLYEGESMSPARTAVGSAVGAIVIWVSGRLLAGRTDEHGVGHLRGARGMSALMIIGVMTVHSFTEGVAVGVALAGEASLGLLISIAIAVHNIPEGVAISLSMVPYGEKPLKAAAWSIFTSLPQPLMAVPAFLAVKTFEPLLPAGLGFAGGAMVWMVVARLIPEMSSDRRIAYPILAVSTVAMVGMEVLIGF